MVCPGLAQKKRSNMAKNETVRIRPIILQEDRDAFSALKNVGGYSPSNASYAVSGITTAQTTLLDKREIEAQKQAVTDSTSFGWMLWNAGSLFRRGGLAPKS